MLICILHLEIWSPFIQKQSIFKPPNGEYDDINARENQIRLIPIEDKVTDEVEADTEQSPKSSLERQTTPEPEAPIEDEIADTAKTNSEHIPEIAVEPQTNSDPSMEDEVANTAKTDTEQAVHGCVGSVVPRRKQVGHP